MIQEFLHKLLVGNLGYVPGGCWNILRMWFQHMDVSENRGTPKSSILIGVSIINHPFWGIPIFGNTHIDFHQWFFSTTSPVAPYENTLQPRQVSASPHRSWGPDRHVWSQNSNWSHCVTWIETLKRHVKQVKHGETWAKHWWTHMIPSCFWALFS